MKRLAMVGDEIIHDFIFPAYINGFQPDLMEQYGGWMAPLFRGEPPGPMSPEVRVVALASPNTALAHRIAEVCGIETVVDHVADLPPNLDGALIMERLGAKHLPMARPFLKAGQYLFIDKPVTESLSDWKTLRTAAEERGVILHGGSSLGYSQAVQAAKAWVAQGPASLVATGPGPWYEYACHLVAIAVEALGPNVRTTQGVGSIARGVANIEWEDGRTACLQWGPYPGAFRVDGFTTAGHQDWVVDDSKTFYRGLAEAFVRGVVDNRSADLDAMEAVIRILDGVGSQLRRDEG